MTIGRFFFVRLTQYDDMYLIEGE